MLLIAHLMHAIGDWEIEALTMMLMCEWQPLESDDLTVWTTMPMSDAILQRLRIVSSIQSKTMN